jgi:hypothetical protein
MDELRDKLEAALKQRFPGVDVEFGPRPTRGKISGVLTWPGFAEYDFVGRQDLVWDLIRERFAQRVLDISTIVTLTPEELNAYSA